MDEMMCRVTIRNLIAYPRGFKVSRAQDPLEIVLYTIRFYIFWIALCSIFFFLQHVQKSGYHNRVAREAAEKQSYHITLGPMEVGSKMGSAKQTSNYGATSSWISASIVAGVMAIGLLVNHAIKKKSKIHIISDGVNESAM